MQKAWRADTLHLPDHRNGDCDVEFTEGKAAIAILLFPRLQDPDLWTDPGCMPYTC